MNFFLNRYGFLAFVSIILSSLILIAIFKYDAFRSFRNQVFHNTIKKGIDKPLITAKILQVFPHDPMAFTQGLVISDGIMFESIGMPKPSVLRKIDLAKGKILQARSLPQHMFAEGIAIVDDKIVQLTWKDGIGFIYNHENLELMGTFKYDGEGWGLTFDGQHLILSDGTSILRLLDPKTFQVVDRIKVTDHNGPVENLNELEFVGGEILANVYEQDVILRINPSDGKVIGSIDLSALYPASEHTHDFAMANGIAYDKATGQLFVTGKIWPKLYEIEWPE